MRAVVAALVVLVAGLASGQLMPPKEWPQRFMMTQIGYWTYNPGTVAVDEIYYDFTTLRYVVKSEVVEAPNTLQGDLVRGSKLANYWFNNTLKIYQTLPALGNKTVCQALDMGFGMPRPDWFMTNATRVFETYAGHKWVNEPEYNLIVWTRKNSPGAGGNMTYFNYLSDNAGRPYTLIAPSPFGEIVNEWYNQTAVDDDADFPAGTFDEPTDVKCHSASLEDIDLDAEPYMRHALAHAGMLQAFGRVGQ